MSMRLHKYLERCDDLSGSQRMWPDEVEMGRSFIRANAGNAMCFDIGCLEDYMGMVHKDYKFTMNGAQA